MNIYYLWQFRRKQGRSYRWYSEIHQFTDADKATKEMAELLTRCNTTSCYGHRLVRVVDVGPESKVITPVYYLSNSKPPYLPAQQ